MRRCSPRVERVSITCVVCGTVRVMLPSHKRQLTGKYCSATCAGMGTRKPTSKTEVRCDQCGILFIKRTDHLKARNFCSRPCSDISRRRTGTAWGLFPDVEKRREYFRAWTEQHREFVNAKSAAWARSHRAYRNYLQQMRRGQGSLCYDDWCSVIARDGGRCVHCGSTLRLEVDHILAVAKGGTTVKENLQTLCRLCNASKGAGTVVKRKLFKEKYGREIIEV
jgi:5-methylcytosine-specific restriction endonuclease McrA